MTWTKIHHDCFTLLLIKTSSAHYASRAQKSLTSFRLRSNYLWGNPRQGSLSFCSSPSLSLSFLGGTETMRNYR